MATSSNITQSTNLPWQSQGWLLLWLESHGFRLLAWQRADINMGVAFCSLPLFPHTKLQETQNFPFWRKKNASCASVKWNNYEKRRSPCPNPLIWGGQWAHILSWAQAQMFPVKRNRNERHNERSKKLNIDPIFQSAWKALRKNLIRTDPLSVRCIS